MTEHPNVFLRSFSVSRTGKHKSCILGKIFERLCSHVQTENTYIKKISRNENKEYILKDKNGTAYTCKTLIMR